jgi:hypothetical protein
MHDVLFQHQKTLQIEHLKTYARSLNLDPYAFDDCLEQGKYTAEVQKDHEDAVAAGIQGTPAFSPGKTRADDSIQGIFIRGEDLVCPTGLYANANRSRVRAGVALARHPPPRR